MVPCEMARSNQVQLRTAKARECHHWPSIEVVQQRKREELLKPLKALRFFLSRGRIKDVRLNESAELITTDGHNLVNVT